MLGAISASLIKNLGTQLYGFTLTLDNYRRVVSTSELYTPLLYSMRLALIVSTSVMMLSVPVARLLTRRSAGSVGRTLDLVLLGAVALPSIVLAAGYILIYNLPVMHLLGLVLYGTTALLALGYVAGALPNNARILIGPLAQLHDTLLTSARTHGAGTVTAWRRVAIPVLSRYIVWVWLYCFAGTLLELPISQLLYPPSQYPLRWRSSGGSRPTTSPVEPRWKWWACWRLCSSPASCSRSTGCLPPEAGVTWGPRRDAAWPRLRGSGHVGRRGRDGSVAGRAQQALRERDRTQ